MRLVTITYLEMSTREQLKARRLADARFSVREATVKQWEFNKSLYILVGREWSWTDKLQWSDSRWQSYAEADNLRTFGAYHDGSIAGYFELKQDDSGGAEIAIFGLAPKFIGRGFGGVLLTQALEEAWQMKPNRVWLHTCSLDHPSALPNYQARGLEIYRVETHQLP